jgi:hypothetical protein
VSVVCLTCVPLVANLSAHKSFIEYFRPRYSRSRASSWRRAIIVVSGIRRLRRAMVCHNDLREHEMQVKKGHGTCDHGKWKNENGTRRVLGYATAPRVPFAGQLRQPTYDGLRIWQYYRAWPRPAGGRAARECSTRAFDYLFCNGNLWITSGLCSVAGQCRSR